MEVKRLWNEMSGEVMSAVVSLDGFSCRLTLEQRH